MPTTGQPAAIGWSRALRVLAITAWAASLAVASPRGEAFAQDLGGQGPTDQAESGPDLGTGGHAEIKAAARKAIAAEKRFVATTKDVYKTGHAPRQADPAIAPLLDAVFDVSLVRKTAILEEDGNAIAEWLRASIHVGAIYVRAANGVTSLSELTSDAKAREQSDRNVAIYAPEIGRFIDAEVVLETALLGTVFNGGPEPQDARLRETRNGMRTALEMTIVSVLRTLAVPGAAYDWRLDRLAVLDGPRRKSGRSSTPAAAPMCEKWRRTSAARCGIRASRTDSRRSATS